MISIILFGVFFTSTRAQFNIVIQGDSVWAIDAISNDTIIQPQLAGGRLWQAFAVSKYPSLSPERKVTAVANGYDINYSFENTSVDTFSMGDLWPANIKMDNTINIKTFKSDNKDEMILDSFGTYSLINIYPILGYSPCIIITDSSLGYTIGISLLYPILEYKHRVQFDLDGRQENEWDINMRLNYSGGVRRDKYLPESELLPGTRRSYKVCVRIIKHSDSDPCAHWLQTLLPYKRYFRNLYGGVTYKKDPRPIAKLETSNMGSNDSINNPYRLDANFLVKNNIRPDIHGYGPVAHYLAKYKALGFDRIMLWTPTGVPWVNRDNSYPFQFTSHWLEGDTLLYPFSYGHNMGDAVDSLRKIVVEDGKLELGLWWGRAGQVMYDWDTPGWERLDPDNPVHVAAGFKELDLAVAAGATIIGLDAFKLRMYSWDAYRWLKMMRQRAPNVKFSCEAAHPDFLNTLGGNFVFRPTSAEIQTPHYLAGFLLPENETWAMPRGDTSVLDEMERLAKMGYITTSYYHITKDPITNMDLYTPGNFLEIHMPFPDLGIDEIICQGSTITLSGVHRDAKSYLWSTGDVTEEINITDGGTYWIQTTNSLGCTYSDTINITVLDTCGSDIINSVVREEIIGGFSIYPNPVHNMATISISKLNYTRKYDIFLYDYMGRLIKRIPDVNNSKYSFYTGEIESGLYFLKINSDKEIAYVQKIIIKN